MRSIKTVLLSITTLASLSTEAQISKGTVFIGGTVSAATSNSHTTDLNIDSKTNTNSFSINPRVGYYVNPNLALGVSLNYQTRRFVTEGGNQKNDNRENAFGVSVFGRYNHFMTKRLAIFFDGSIGYTTGNSKNIQTISKPFGGSTLNRSTGYFNGLSASVVPGLLYFVRPWMAFEATYGRLAYDYTNSKNELSPNFSNKNSDLNMNWGLSTITLGVNFYIAPKKRPSNREPRIIEVIETED